MEQNNGALNQNIPASANTANAAFLSMQQSQSKLAEATEIDLVELFWALLHNWKPIVLCALIGAVIFGAYHTTRVRPSYQATTEMYITSTDSVISLAELQVGNALATDYQNIIVSRAVLNQVIDDLQLTTDYRGLRKLITTENPANTHIIRTKVTTNDLTLSRDIANDLLLSSIDHIYQVIGSNEPTVIEYSQAEAVESVAPGIVRYMAIGAVMGVLVVAAFVVIRTMMNTTLKNDDDVEKYLSLPVLAAVPYYKD